MARKGVRREKRGQGKGKGSRRFLPWKLIGGRDREELEKRNGGTDQREAFFPGLRRLNIGRSGRVSYSPRNAATYFLDGNDFYERPASRSNNYKKTTKMNIPLTAGGRVTEIYRSAEKFPPKFKHNPRASRNPTNRELPLLRS